ncbi:MAG: glycosyltransferase involved in cell wall biosynthesis [Phycisphaerales bacterium]
MSLRILHISTRLILGGSQENTLLSCEGQARLGHRVHLAFGPIYGPEGSMLQRVRHFELAPGSGQAIRTHEVHSLVRAINPRQDRKCLAELGRLIRELRPDVVHTHSSKAGILGRAAAWKVKQGSMLRRPAVIHTIHGPPFMPVMGNAVARKKTELKNHLYTLAERRAAGQCDRIVSVADSMTEQFLARGIGKPEQYITVRSGMETGPYLEPEPGQTRTEIRRAAGLGERDFVIGTVARLAEHKGHDDVLDALAEPLRANPGWKLLWVGDGWWRPRLMKRVKELGLLGQVVCTGLVEPDKIPGLVRSMDVLLHPSLREGLPRTVPQAMLSGVPVVATDADGTREACLDGQTGRLVPVGDAAAIREAVLWMHQNPEERAAMGTRGREITRDEFSAERMVQRLEEVYADALG